jgi:hypothetical protein
MCMSSPPTPSGPSQEELDRQKQIQEQQLADLQRKEDELSAAEKRREDRLQAGRLGYASLFTSGAGGAGFEENSQDKRTTLG